MHVLGVPILILFLDKKVSGHARVRSTDINKKVSGHARVRTDIDSVSTIFRFDLWNCSNIFVFSCFFLYINFYTMT